MPAYRIRHVPTGMFYRPSSEVIANGWGIHVKTNLSKTGKAYVKRPSLAQIGSLYYNHLAIPPIKDGQSILYNRPKSPALPVVESEWIIEEA